LPNVTGLSPVNIRYMERFYLLYKDKIQIFPQLVEELFSIPWGHHRYIIDKCKNVDGDFEINVRTDKDNDTVWLTQKDLTLLFNVDNSWISRHIKNILSEVELDLSVVAENATTGNDGKCNNTFIKWR